MKLKNLLIVIMLTLACFIFTPTADAVTFTKLNDPATLPSGAGRGAAFSPDGSLFAIAHTTTPFVTVYDIQGNTFTKLASPAQLPAGNGASVAFSPDSTILFVGHTTTPFLTMYGISGNAQNRVLTKFGGTAPFTLPASQVNGLSMSPYGYLATCGTTSPFIRVYSVSGSGTNAVVSDAGATFNGTATGSLPATGVQGCQFNPAGDAFVATEASSPFIDLYQVGGTSFTRCKDPSSLPTSAPIDVTWDDDSTFSAPDGGSLFHLNIYSTGSLVGGSCQATKSTEPAVLPTSGINGVDFSPDGNILTLGVTNSPFILQYNFPALTQITAPSSLPAGKVNRIKWNPSGTLIGMGVEVSPFIATYSTIPPAAGPGTLYANITVKSCGVGALSGVTCSQDLGLLSGASVTMSAPFNLLSYGTQVSGSLGTVNFTWTIPQGQSGIIAAFTISKTGFNTQTYNFAISGNYTNTLYIDRSQGFNFFNFTVDFCGDTIISSTCSNDQGPIPSVSYSTTGATTQTGTTDNAGTFILAVSSTNVAPFTISLSKNGYANAAYTFQNPNTNYVRTLFMGIVAASCAPYNGNFTVPNQAAINVTLNTIESAFWSIFKAQGNGLTLKDPPGITLLNSQPGSIINLTYPPGRQTTATTTGTNDLGSYIFVISDQQANIIATCPFIIQNGEIETQIIPDNAINATITAQILSSAQFNSFTQSEATNQQTTQTIVGTAIDFAFASPLLIPNMYIVWFLSLIAALIIARARRN